MKQLTVKDILDLANYLHQSGMSAKEVMAMPIYIGDDDELNGIHTAWCVGTVDPNDEEDEYVIEMIADNFGNMPLKGKAIVIS